MSSTHDHAEVFDGTFRNSTRFKFNNSNNVSRPPEQGTWYSEEELLDMRLDMMQPASLMREIRWDQSRHMAWIPDWLAQQLGLPPGGPWRPPPTGGPSKKPNDQGVIHYLAGRCREVVAS